MKRKRIKVKVREVNKSIEKKSKSKCLLSKLKTKLFNNEIGEVIIFIIKVFVVIGIIILINFIFKIAIEHWRSMNISNYGMLLIIEYFECFFIALEINIVCTIIYYVIANKFRYYILKLEIVAVFSFISLITTIIVALYVPIHINCILLK